ncbi:MAG: hypothetical protein QME81_08385 [bacterium]|nr:hypothetical protein [bacterium]
MIDANVIIIGIAGKYRYKLLVVFRVMKDFAPGVATIEYVIQK